MTTACPASRRTLHIMHVTTATSREAAGVQAAVDGMVSSLATTRHIRVTQVGLLPGHETWEASCGVEVERFRLRSIGPRTFSYTPELGRSFLREQPDVIHLHGVWQYPGVAAMGRDRPLGSFLMLSPHGMLASRALVHRSARKRAAWLLYQRRALANVDLFHVTSSVELADVRRCGLRQPVAVIPFGVDVSPYCPVRGPTGPMKAVFLSRIHPIKGLIDLVRAWAAVKPDGWRLVISGPDECGHLQEVKKTIADAELQDDITLEGPRWGAERAAFVADADLFILPSHSENFGIVVAEALAQGVPVLATYGTPWECIAHSGCGWWVPTGERGLARGLAEATSRDRDALLEMGRRGWKMMAERFAWSTCASRLAAVYEWACGMGGRPDSVHFYGEDG